MTSTKDLLLGDGGSAPSTGGAYVPPPIDSSLQGAPGAQSNQAAAPTPAQQPAQAPTPQPTGTDKSQQVASAPVSSVAASTLQPPPIATPPIASTSSTPAAQPTGTDKSQQQGQTTPSTAPATPVSDADEDDELARYQKYIDEYKAKRDKNLGDINSYLDKMAEEYKQPTAEELEKERKKRKRNQIFNAISDGIQALSNLYFTTQYAPNSYNPKNSLSAKAQERYDKIDKEREGKRGNLYNILMKKYEVNGAADKDDLDMLTGLEKLKADKAAAKAKAEAANAAAARDQENKDRDYNFKVQKQKDEAERAKARDAEAARHNRAQEAIGKQNAATSAARASGSGGGGGSRTKYTLNIGGKVYTYSSQADYERAVQRYAKGKNLRTMQSVEDGTDVYGNPKRKVSAKPMSQLAAEVEDAYSKNPKQAGFNANSYKRQPAKKSTSTTKPPLN